MNATVDDVLDVAREEIGYKEGGRNDTKYGRWYGMNHAAWCAMFVSWVADQAGAVSIIPRHAWTPSGAQWFRDRDRFGSTPRAGAVVYYDWPGDGVNRIQHVGFVEKVHADGTITTIEGNTSSGNVGSQSNGDGVYRRHRTTRDVIGFGYPAYAGESLPDTGRDDWDGKSFPGRDAFRVGHSHPAVTALDKRLIAHGFAKHHDGDGYQPGPTYSRYTRQNVREFQEAQGWRGADADGYPGPETWKRLMAAPKAKPRPPAKPKPRGPVVDLSKLRNAAKADPPRASSKAAYPSGTKVVEDALVAEGLLDRKRADRVGHFGSDTVAAYGEWQERLGYRGRDADGIPGKTSLRKLGAKHGFRVGA